jgi:glycosyltransferase involved in cell wall biosynthesis
VLGVPIVYLDYWDIPILTHAVSLISLCVVLARLSTRQSVLIFYNYHVHYVGALLMSRLTGRRCILDLEDGCRVEEGNLRHLFASFLLMLHNCLCNGGAMLASIALKKEVRTTRTFVCYGVAETIPIVARDWLAPCWQVLFSGSLLKDTGADLFLETLHLLARRNPGVLMRLKFVVTGFGACAEAIQSAAAGTLRHCLSYRGRVTSREFQSIVRHSHIGLCLKMPSRGMGMTTFPSKVVELASCGLLIVSTRVSDVPVLFDDASAILLGEATASALAQALEVIAQDAARTKSTALGGQRRVAALLSEDRVGNDVLQFWTADL